MASKQTIQAAKAYMIAFVNKLDPSGRNGENLKRLYDGMTDAKFLEVAEQIRNKQTSTPFIYDHLTSNKINLTHVTNVVEKELGIKLRQRIRFQNPKTKEFYWSNEPVWVLDCPVRRMIQSIENKISFAETKQMDAATHQPVGGAKASSISAPEALILEGQGFEATTAEFLVVRGGDLGAKHAMDQSIRTSGGASLNVVMQYGQGAKASKYVSHQLTAMHWRNNLAGG